MRTIISSAAMVLCVAASPASAGPGDPFGGDDGGCVPADKIGYVCGQRIAQALGKLTASVIKCHLVQAGQAFKTGHSSTGFDNAEDNCSEGPSNTSAKAKFDAVLAKYGPMCGPSWLATAQARRDVLLADQSNLDSLDALNGSFFCDDTSGLTIAEPGGDDAGFIPADANADRCVVAIARGYGKLVVSTYKCHAKAAKAGLAGKPFDEEACEEAGPKGVLARYDALVQRYLTLGGCPACLAASAGTLGSDVVADLDTQNADVFPCPPP